MNSAAALSFCALLLALPAPEVHAEGNPGGEAGVPSVEALRRGNQLFRGGNLEEAAAAYRAGWDPGHPHSLLAYNLGSTLHHLDRLPEAILWYRRAEGGSDPWIEENLRLARRTLGTPRAPDPGPLALLAARSRQLAGAAILLAWLVPIASLLPGRFRTWGAGLLALLSLTLGATSVVAEQRAPREVVLLADCRGADSELPAGTEAWAEPTAAGWSLVGVPLVCPEEAVAAIEPEGQ